MSLSDLPPKQQKLSLTPAQAWEKIKPFCGYQERCHKEVKEKLYSYGLHKQDVEQAISRLIEENYLNEERFAKMYASGHARIKGWGRVKITAGLKQKGVSPYCIKIALRELDDKDYDKELEKIASKKWQALKGQPKLARKFKCRQFLLQRGYESPLVYKIIAALERNELED